MPVSFFEVIENLPRWQVDYYRLANILAAWAFENSL
jgi:hypothetical protein